MAGQCYYVIIAHLRRYFKVWVQVVLSSSGTCDNPSEKHCLEYYINIMKYNLFI